VLFAEPSVGQFYKHDSPYTYFSSTELHLGEISLECSRPGAAAAGLWATQKLLPLERGGEFARLLCRGREAALGLYKRLREDTRFVTAFAPELDIVIWVPRAETVSAASRQAQRIFEQAALRNLHLALATVPVAFFGSAHGMEADAGAVRCLRSVLMKPDHYDWLDRIWALLDQATNAAKSPEHP
jgi:glutamate/tyrosine decarboxylase-like PLP-dependent enzyme